MRGTDSLELRNKEVQIVGLGDLLDQAWERVHELRGSQVVQNVQVETVLTARKECGTVLAPARQPPLLPPFSLLDSREDISPHNSEHQRAGVHGLQVPAGHLQNQ